jgi:hypothetical protein
MLTAVGPDPISPTGNHSAPMLLFIGTAFYTGSIILGAAIALVYITTKRITHFKYGTFYNVFALVGATGMCFGSVCFFFLYLRKDMATFLTVMTSCILVGLLLFALRMKKDSRILFAILSFYWIFTVYLSPLFLWNMIYLLFIAKKRAEPPAVPATAART